MAVIISGLILLFAVCLGLWKLLSNGKNAAEAKTGIKSDNSNELNANLPRANQFKILTYNVLADQAQASQRIPALMKLLETSDADVIALQEVAPWFIKQLDTQPWAKQYHNETVDGKHAYTSSGDMILSRTPIKNIDTYPFPGRQNRWLLIAHTEIDGNPFALATAHLESMLDDGLIRAKQLDMVFDKLGGAENAVFLGDMNFGDGEQPEIDHLKPGYFDTWRTLNPDDPGYTWNIEKSDMAKTGSFPNEISRRIDRILVHSKILRPVDIKIIGDKPVDKDSAIFPSDNFGLISTFLKVSETSAE